MDGANSGEIGNYNANRERNDYRPEAARRRCHQREAATTLEGAESANRSEEVAIRGGGRRLKGRGHMRRRYK